MIDGRNFFDQPVKDELRTNNNVWKNKTGQRYDYKFGCLVVYHYFKDHYKMIAIM